MTKYYIGYEQDNYQYVYVANITSINIGVTTITDNALSFDNANIAKGVLNYIKTKVANVDYRVLKIVTDIEEVE